MKKLVLLILILLAPTVVRAESAPDERPHWSLEFKGGENIPAISGWSKYYDKRSNSEYGGALAYKITRWMEAGVEGAIIKGNGAGTAQLHNSVSGNVTFESYPLSVFVLARGVFSEDQWIVPYVGGGWTRLFYREKVQYQGISRGFADGYHARAGLQLLLDNIDPSAANDFYLEYGVTHTYFFIEAERIKANAQTVSSGSVDLGGTSFLGGLLFEF